MISYRNDLQQLTGVVEYGAELIAVSISVTGSSSKMNERLLQVYYVCIGTLIIHPNNFCRHLGRSILQNIIFKERLWGKTAPRALGWGGIFFLGSCQKMVNLGNLLPKQDKR